MKLLEISGIMQSKIRLSLKMDRKTAKMSEGTQTLYAEEDSQNPSQMKCFNGHVSTGTPQRQEFRFSLLWSGVS